MLIFIVTILYALSPSAGGCELKFVYFYNYTIEHIVALRGRV